MKRKLKKLQAPRKGIQYIIYPETRKELSPFAFFDAGTMQRNDDGLFIGMHPHSGIGIITYFEGANLRHDDSGKHDNIIHDGGVQWIRAGGGIWHQENYLKKENAPDNWSMTLHQLWLQLPPELEESDIEYQNFQPVELPTINNVKIIVGRYKDSVSPVKVPFEMTYLDVSMQAGENFSYDTPPGQSTGFIFPRSGNIELHGEALPLNHLSILENNEGKIEIQATSDAKFVVVMGVPQPQHEVIRGGSIHSSEEAMDRSMRRIQNIGAIQQR